jgi:hypothetical protein
MALVCTQAGLGGTSNKEACTRSKLARGLLATMLLHGHLMVDASRLRRGSGLHRAAAVLPAT